MNANELLKCEVHPNCDGTCAGPRTGVEITQEALEARCSCGWAFGEKVGSRDRCDSCQEVAK